MYEMDGGRCGTRGEVSLDTVRFRYGSVVLYGRGVHSPDGSAGFSTVRFGVCAHAPGASRVVLVARAEYAASGSEHG